MRKIMHCKSIVVLGGLFVLQCGHTLSCFLLCVLWHVLRCEAQWGVGDVSWVRISVSFLSDRRQLPDRVGKCNACILYHALNLWDARQVCRFLTIQQNTALEGVWCVATFWKSSIIELLGKSRVSSFMGTDCTNQVRLYKSANLRQRVFVVCCCRLAMAMASTKTCSPLVLRRISTSQRGHQACTTYLSSE